MHAPADANSNTAELSLSKQLNLWTGQKCLLAFFVDICSYLVFYNQQQHSVCSTVLLLMHLHVSEF